MLCHNCSLKSECKTICEDVEQYLKSRRNYKTTYVNKEVSFTPRCEAREGYLIWLAKAVSKNVANRSNTYRTQLPRIKRVIDTQLTEKQKRIMIMHFFKGMGLSEIGRKLHISEQAVSQTIYGHSTWGGRRDKKDQKTTCRN